METARWRQIQEIFHVAVELPQAEQSAFVQVSCGGDQQLTSEVLAMLRQDAGDSLLDRGVANVAHQMFGEASSIPFKELGAYRIINLLGEGGMGVVYLAER